MTLEKEGTNSGMKSLNKKVEGEKKFAVIAMAIFILLIANAGSEEIEKYENLKKENISPEADASLKEYYSAILGASAQDAKFNTISTKDEIAIVNVTVDGKDKRILSRVTRAVGLPKAESALGQFIKAGNITVLENLWVLGREIFSINTSFGARDFFSAKSNSERLFDEGRSRVIDGMANVSINPVFAGLVSSYNAYVSPQGLTKGIYVAEKAGNYFIVKGVNKKSNVGFSWLISGAKSDEQYRLSNDDGLKIKAVIDSEAGAAEIEIWGIGNLSANISYSLITGNVVLEENLSEILEDEPTPLPNVNESEEINESERLGNNTIDEGGIEGSKPEGKKFKLYNTDEDYIIERISSVTGLGAEQVKRHISFFYKDSEDSVDEIIDEPQFPKGIESVNGSIIIRLGGS